MYKNAEIQSYFESLGVTKVEFFLGRVVLTIPYLPPCRGSSMYSGKNLEEAIKDIINRKYNIPTEVLNKDNITEIVTSPLEQAILNHTDGVSHE
jgi:hypothetical protein